MDLDQEMDKLAQLVALRAQRKMGKKPDLRTVERESESKPEEPRPPTSLPPALPDQTAFQPIDVSPRAQTMHAIVQIANVYNWQSAITHFLMMKGVPYLSDLTDPQLDDLLDRMYGYVDAAETGSSLPDCLPAH